MWKVLIISHILFKWGGIGTWIQVCVTQKMHLRLFLLDLTTYVAKIYQIGLYMLVLNTHNLDTILQLKYMPTVEQKCHGLCYESVRGKFWARKPLTYSKMSLSKFSKVCNRLVISTALLRIDFINKQIVFVYNFSAFSFFETHKQSKRSALLLVQLSCALKIILKEISFFFNSLQILFGILSLLAFYNEQAKYMHLALFY